ncbi:MAG: signal peptidase II [Thermomicrobiales bacterium]
MPAFRDAVALAAIAALVIAADQLTKAALISALGPAQPASRFELGVSWLALEYAENRGASFGLFQGVAPILAVASIAIVVALLVRYFGTASPPLWSTIGIGAIVGGAIGNLLDRIRLGFVIDFVSVGPWPNFNVADSAITLGVLLLAWGWLRPARGASERGIRCV